MKGGEARGLFDDCCRGVGGEAEAGDDDHHEAATYRHYLCVCLASVLRACVDARSMLQSDARAEDRGRRSSDDGAVWLMICDVLSLRYGLPAFLIFTHAAPTI